MSRLDIRPEEGIHLKLHDEIPVFHVEIDLASKTPKQDEEEEDCIPDDDTTTTKQNDAINAILAQVPKCNDESSEQFLQRIETIRHQITPIITGQHDEMTFTRFRRRHHDNVVNQVCPNGDFQIVQDQLQNSEIQRMIRILSQNETPPNHANFECQFFQKLVKNKKRLEVVNNVLYRSFFDGTGKIKCEQIVVPPETIHQIVQSLHNEPLQGHLGSSKMLHQLRKRYYSPNLSEIVLQYVSNCQDCIRSKPIRKTETTPPLQQIYDPCNGPEDVLEIYLVGDLPPSNGFTHVLTACDYFSRYLFAVPIRKPDTKSVVEALVQNFTQHSYVPKIISTDKGSTFTSQLFNSLMESAGIKIEHATVKLAQTIGMVKRSHQKLKQILKINVSADSPQWHKYVNMAVMAHNTTYHQAIRCTPTEIFHGRVPFNALDIKFGNPRSESRNTTDVTGILFNMNKKFQQTHDNIIEAFHKYKNDYDRKAQASPLK